MSLLDFLINERRVLKILINTGSNGSLSTDLKNSLYPFRYITVTSRSTPILKHSIKRNIKKAREKEETSSHSFSSHSFLNDRA